MDAVSLNSEPAYDDEADGYEVEGDCGMSEFTDQTGSIQGENPLPPAVGMEFDSYEDVYFFYNCYAKDQGFGVRVSNTWYRKSKERYRGKLSCSSAGFKKKSEANRPRPETRTGCPAMIKFRLMDTKRWRIIEVEIEHNHLTSPASGKFYKSHKIMDSGTKRTWQSDSAEKLKKVRLFRTVIIDADNKETTEGDEGEFRNEVDNYNYVQLKLKQGDARALHDFFSMFQLMNPNFFYLMDINEKGCLRNVFWAEERARVSYGYFGDVIYIDTTCLTDKYNVPLVAFTSVNHHKQPILLGCGLLSNESIESYIWLFRAWLTCMLGRPPQVVITDYSKILQTAIADVFPRASHCLCLSKVMQEILDRLGGLLEFESFKVALNRGVYHSFRAGEFESAWDNIIQRHGIRDHKWLHSLYEERKRWVPMYLKEIFLADMFPTKQSETLFSIFEGHLNKHTPLKDFIDKYDKALENNHKKEAMADMESRNSSFAIKPRFYFELQLSKLYTNYIFKNFQKEVDGMLSCFSTRQTNPDGPIITFIVKEHVEIDENRREITEYEVSFNTCEVEVSCVCGLFNFKGYLCRHALSVLNQNGIEEIPPQYILSRWRKDIVHSYVLDHSSCGIDNNNPVHRYDNLYKFVLKVVEEGRKSQDNYKITLQALDEILSKVHIVDHPSM